DKNAPPPPRSAPSKGVPPQMSHNSELKDSSSVLQGSATRKVKPDYPAIARAARKSGAVKVQITVNERGEVTNAQAISGRKILRDAAIKSAKQWRFKPTELSGKPVKTQGVITFNFTPGKKASSSAAVPLTPLIEEWINRQMLAKLHPAIV